MAITKNQQHPPFPSHIGALELQHNEFFSDFDDVGEWVDYCECHGGDGSFAVPEWESDDTKQRSIDINEVWTLHWYHTQIGFHYIAAPTFDELMDFASLKSAKH